MPNFNTLKEDVIMCCKEEKKSIETKFQGIWYRSKAEARFAFLLTELGIKFAYESEGFSLTNGLNYLPDFLLLFENGETEVLEVKGFMEDLDMEKINGFEKDFEKKVIVGAPDMTMTQSGEEISLTKDGVKKGGVSPEFMAAVERAKNYVFNEEKDRMLKTEYVKKDALSALMDLSSQYLNKFYTLSLSGEEPCLVNPVNTPEGGTTPFRILITKSERKDFDVAWYYCDKQKFSISVLERQVKDACYKIWSLSMLLLREPDKMKWREIKERKLNDLIDYLRGDEQRGE